MKQGIIQYFYIVLDQLTSFMKTKRPQDQANRALIAVNDEQEPVKTSLNDQYCLQENQNIQTKNLSQTIVLIKTHQSNQECKKFKPSFIRNQVEKRERHYQIDTVIKYNKEFDVLQECQKTQKVKIQSQNSAKDQQQEHQTHTQIDPQYEDFEFRRLKEGQTVIPSPKISVGFQIQMMGDLILKQKLSKQQLQSKSDEYFQGFDQYFNQTAKITYHFPEAISIIQELDSQQFKNITGTTPPPPPSQQQQPTPPPPRALSSEDDIKSNLRENVPIQEDTLLVEQTMERTLFNVKILNQRVFAKYYAATGVYINTNSNSRSTYTSALGQAYINAAGQFQINEKVVLTSASQVKFGKDANGDDTTSFRFGQIMNGKLFGSGVRTYTTQSIPKQPKQKVINVTNSYEDLRSDHNENIKLWGSNRIQQLQQDNNSLVEYTNDKCFVQLQDISNAFKMKQQSNQLSCLNKLYDGVGKSRDNICKNQKKIDQQTAAVQTVSQSQSQVEKQHQSITSLLTFFKEQFVRPDVSKIRAVIEKIKSAIPNITSESERNQLIQKLERNAKIQENYKSKGCADLIDKLPSFDANQMSLIIQCLQLADQQAKNVKQSLKQYKEQKVDPNYNLQDLNKISVTLEQEKKRSDQIYNEIKPLLDNKEQRLRMIKENIDKANIDQTIHKTTHYNRRSFTIYRACFPVWIVRVCFVANSNINVKIEQEINPNTNKATVFSEVVIDIGAGGYISIWVARAGVHISGVIGNIRQKANMEPVPGSKSIKQSIDVPQKYCFAHDLTQYAYQVNLYVYYEYRKIRIRWKRWRIRISWSWRRRVVYNHVVSRGKQLYQKLLRKCAIIHSM